jgi:hypothetical protein
MDGRLVSLLSACHNPLKATFLLGAICVSRMAGGRGTPNGLAAMLETLPYVDL